MNLLIMVCALVFANSHCASSSGDVQSEDENLSVNLDEENEPANLQGNLANNNNANSTNKSGNNSQNLLVDDLENGAGNQAGNKLGFNNSAPGSEFDAQVATNSQANIKSQGSNQLVEMKNNSMTITNVSANSQPLAQGEPLPSLVETPAPINVATEQKQQELTSTNVNSSRLKWLGYDYQRENKVVNLIFDFDVIPSYQVSEGTNLGKQKELTYLFASTKAPQLLKRDLNASEFFSPVAFVRLRQDTQNLTVTLTLRDDLEPEVKTTQTGYQLSFPLGERYLGSPGNLIGSQSKATLIETKIEAAESGIMAGPEIKKATSSTANQGEKADIAEPASDLGEEVPAENGQNIQNESEGPEVSPDRSENINSVPPQGYHETARHFFTVASDFIDEPFNSSLEVGNTPVENTGLNSGQVEPPQNGSVDVSGAAMASQNAETMASGGVKGKAITLSFRGAPLNEVIRTIMNETGINFTMPPDIGRIPVFLDLREVYWVDALKAILQTHSLGFVDVAPNLVRIDLLEKLNAEKDMLENMRQKTIKLTDTTILMVRLSYGRAEEVAPRVSEILRADKSLDPRVNIAADNRTNSIFVEAIPQVLGKVKAIIERLDTQTPQVKIESRIVELIKTTNNFLGINWGQVMNYNAGRGLGFGSLVFPNSLSSSFAVDTGGNSARVGNFNFLVGSINGANELDLRLAMEESKGNTEILESTNITVQDNMEARIKAGTADYFRTNVWVTSGNNTGMTQIEYYLTLTVTPNITSDGNVLMRLKVTSKNPRPSQAARAEASSTDREVETTLIRSSGETAAIGGLYTTSKIEKFTGIPFLSSIPIIGALFRSSDKSESRRELVVLITPTIVNYTGKNPAQNTADFANSTISTNGTKGLGNVSEGPAPTQANAGQGTNNSNTGLNNNSQPAQNNQTNRTNGLSQENMPSNQNNKKNQMALNQGNGGNGANQTKVDNELGGESFESDSQGDTGNEPSLNLSN